MRRPEGLYCPAGDFYIDPWRAVDRAVITHAHADHSRAGHNHYLAHQDAEAVMKTRLGDIRFQGLAYGETLTIGGAKVSLHPAGHVLGSAQVRVQTGEGVWVASGDYFVSGTADLNTTCEPFEPVRCDCFITESTFGLPIYRWAPQVDVMSQINQWWSENAAGQRASLLLGYSLGKAQRLLAGVDVSVGPVFVHPAVARINEAYRHAGVKLPASETLTADTDSKRLRGALVIAPPAVHGSRWVRKLGRHSDAFASGWMRLRGARRRRGTDRGFVLSDHADWPGLTSAIAATQADKVIVTHGYEDVMVRWLSERGLQAGSFETDYDDDRLESADDPDSLASVS